MHKSSYTLNFGANNKNLETLYTAYGEGKGMPITYDLFLIADFDTDKYYLKIKEK